MTGSCDHGPEMICAYCGTVWRLTNDDEPDAYTLEVWTNIETEEKTSDSNCPVATYEIHMATTNVEALVTKAMELLPRTNLLLEAWKDGKVIRVMTLEWESKYTHNVVMRKLHGTIKARAWEGGKEIMTPEQAAESHGRLKQLMDRWHNARGR